MKTRLCCSLLSMLLAAVPILGEGPNVPKLVANQCATSTLPSAATPRFVTAQGSCSAACGDMGGSVTISCTGTCTIVDQDCNAGVQGYVECQGGARADCATCQWCSVQGDCPEGGRISCGTWGYEGLDCRGGNGACYVLCDGNYEFCPGHEFQRFCMF